MDLNLELLLVLMAVGAVFGVVAAIVMSESVRRYGLIEVLRRAFTTGPGRNPYAG